jgi:DNA gyrase subunit A
MGVIGMNLTTGDEVIAMQKASQGESVMIVSEKGLGKCTLTSEFTPQNRGGKGVKTINITDKTGDLIAIQAVTDENDLMIINRSGVTIRTKVEQIRVAGRATQGVKIINLREGDVIASVMAVPVSDEEEIEENVVVAEGAEATTEVVADATSEQAAAPEQTTTEE